MFDDLLNNVESNHKFSIEWIYHNRNEINIYQDFAFHFIIIIYIFHWDNEKIKYKKGSICITISQLQSNFLSNYFFISFINVSMLLHFFREF